MSGDVSVATNVLVIGGGLAGLTTATRLARKGWEVTVVDELCAGGRLLNIGQVTDLPGQEAGLSGPELAAQCTEAALDAGVGVLPARVIRLHHGESWRSETTEGIVEARAVVLATGRTPDMSSVPGADEYVGRGLSFCAACDGPLYAGQDVTIAGESRWMASEVEHLASMARAVTVITAGQLGPDGDSLVGRWPGLTNVEVLPQSRVSRLVGGERGLETVCVETAEHSLRDVQAGALFLCDDQMPSIPLGLAETVLDVAGGVQTSTGGFTSQPGLFAAGDVRSSYLPFLVSAAADGIRAAAAVDGYLRADQT